MAEQKVLIIVGPTASGKSALAVTLARKFNGEIISADSRQVYRGLNIGTGKITEREMKGVPHHLLDVAPPKKVFSAHDFAIHASSAIASVASRGKMPIIVGGTGFYIDALVGRIALPNVPRNKNLREKLERKTAAQLFSLLKKRDSNRAQTIDRHNKHRLVRALEIIQAIGSVPKANDVGRRYDELWIGISYDTQLLAARIRRRLLSRLKDGMITEARNLHRHGLSYKRMEELGLEYRFLAHFLHEKITQSDFEIQLQREIMHYAKRQMTYWKRNGDIRWFIPPTIGTIEKSIRQFLALS